MHLRELWLTDVRSYAEVAVGFPDGLTAVLGPNGNGKTNLLEAVGYLATLRSIPGLPPRPWSAWGRSGEWSGARSWVTTAGST